MFITEKMLIKPNDVDDIIKTYYVPLSTKEQMIKTAIDRSFVKASDGSSYLDYVRLRVEYTICIMAMYTHLNVSFNKNDYSYHVDCYDALHVNNFIEDIFHMIENGDPDAESVGDSLDFHSNGNDLMECQTICDCILQTYREGETRRTISQEQLISNFTSIINNIANLNRK